MRTCGVVSRVGVSVGFLGIFSLLAAAPTYSQTPVAARVGQTVDNAQRVTLSGNVHPLARPEFDRGAAPADLPLERMLLVLKPSEAQQAELKKLLDDQQDAHSASYRKWLTPDEFGQKFGATDGDIQAISEWLRSQGFTVDKVYRGRTLIEFSGSAEQVQAAFGTAIHKYVVNGEAHWANTTEQQIPAALATVVAGVLTLHNFYKKPQLHMVDGDFTAKAPPGEKPQFTSSTGLHALVPADYYTIYSINPLQVATQAKIAVVGRTNINVQDIAQFHSIMSDNANPPQIVLNGPDPGDLGGGEEAEAVLDTTWSGAVAPTASVYLVVSQSTATTDGADLSEAYIIDNNAWDVMSESFGVCEAGFTSAQATAIGNLAQQAAAQGITYAVATGDSGSAGCDDPSKETVASGPLSVNLLAATPYTVAVGGTMFNENSNPAKYWAPTNTPGTLGSALSYIPENVWNESCETTQSGCTRAGIWAGGGGASMFFSRPSWQTGVAGIPAGSARDLPDVSLTAAGHDPYLICLDGSCVPNAQGFIRFAGVGGTSAATPAFAGIMALVGQTNQVRLGQPNYVLYRLAAAETLASCNGSNTTAALASTCVFNDVTVGNNAVPGVAGYGTPTAPYQSGTGYDLATGLGSVNVSNLIGQWNSVTFNATTTNFTISPVAAAHGTPLNVSVQVAPTSGTGTPTGYVWLTQTGYPQGNFVGDSTADLFTLASGAFTGTTCLLPGGQYQVYAHYAGDGTYGGSDSTPKVQVNIQPELTTLTFSVLAASLNGTLAPYTGGPYGTPVSFEAQVAGSSGCGTPTGNVLFYNNGPSLVQVSLDKNGNAVSAPTLLNAGTYAITAAFTGDNSFVSSANMTPITFTVGQVGTATSLTSQQTAQALTLEAFVIPQTGSGAPTGSVTFTSGSTVLGAGSVVPVNTTGGAEALATFNVTQLAAGQYTVVANYSGDANYTASASAALPLNLVADFSVANTGLVTQTVSAGLPALYANDIVVTPLFGFSASVNLSCTTTAPAAFCSVNPAFVAGANGTATVTVTTTMRSAGVFTAPGNGWRLWVTGGLTATAVLLVMLVVVAANAPQPRRAAGVAFLLLLFAGGLGMAACGGGSSSPPTPSGTLAGVYSVLVTGTSGSTSHSTTLTLVVQ